MNTSDKKALIYCRVSSKKQENDGSGNSSQEKRCREYAALHSYEVVTVFQDAFSGGGDFMKRPAMRQLLAYVDENPQKYVVIFDDLKRFARDVKFHWELRAEFQLRNLKPECLNFTFDESPEGAFIETIIAAQGELERHQNKRAVVQKMTARMKRGIYCLGTLPYGYEYLNDAVHGGKTLHIHKQNAEVLRQAFEGFASGALFHIKDVARFLNKYGTKYNRKSFTLSATKNLLTNILYVGIIEYPKWNISALQGIHEPIIPLEIFEKVQEKIYGKIPQRTRKDMSEDFPLRGYVNCIHCHHPLTASWSTSRTKDKHAYYRCNGKECLMKGKSIAQKDLHDDYMEHIEPLTPKPEIRNTAKLRILATAIRKQKKKFVETKSHKDKADVLDEQISGLVEHIIANPANPLVEVYEKEIVKLKRKKLLVEAEITQSEHIDAKELEPLVDKAFEPFENPYDTWKNGNYQKRKLVQNILFNANVEYDKNSGFGTSIKSYILRLYEKIEEENTQNLMRVHSPNKSWNLQKAQTYIDKNWNHLMKEIKNINEADKPMENKQRKSKVRSLRYDYTEYIFNGRTLKTGKGSKAKDTGKQQVPDVDRLHENRSEAA